jgi:hypothetical protein
MTDGRATAIEHAHIRADGMIRLDGCTCARVVVHCGIPYIEFKDRNGQRARDLGRELLRIRWRDLVDDVEEHLGSAVI